MTLYDGMITFAALFSGFLVQTITGFAGGLVSLPFLLFVFPIDTSVAIISVFNFSFSVFQVSKKWQHIDRSVYRDLAPATVIGVLIGAIILSYGSPIILKKVLGVFVLAYIAYRFLKPPTFKITRFRSALLGLVGGFFAGLFSSGAPPFVIYMANRFSDPVKFRSNLIGVLAVTNVMRPVVLIFTGVMTLQILGPVLWGIPGFLLALYSGEKVFQQLNKERFLQIVFLFLGISGVLLIVR